MATSLQVRSARSRVRFAEFEFDVRTLELSLSGEPLALQPRPARVLTVLVQAKGELVTPDELRRQVWGEDLQIDFEQSLKTCIKQIRAALGDDAAAPRFVETLPRRGYRFITAVRATAEATESDGEAAPTARSGRLWSGVSSREMTLVGVIAILMLALAIVLLLGA